MRLLVLATAMMLVLAACAQEKPSTPVTEAAPTPTWAAPEVTPTVSMPAPTPVPDWYSSLSALLEETPDLFDRRGSTLFLCGGPPVELFLVRNGSMTALPAIPSAGLRGTQPAGSPWVAAAFGIASSSACVFREEVAYVKPDSVGVFYLKAVPPIAE